MSKTDRDYEPRSASSASEVAEGGRYRSRGGDDFLVIDPVDVLPITVEGVAQDTAEFGLVNGESFQMQHQIGRFSGPVRITISRIPRCETCHDDGWIMVPSAADPELPDQAPCPDCITPCESFCPSCDGTCQLPGGRNFRAATREQTAQAIDHDAGEPSASALNQTIQPPVTDDGEQGGGA